jgi:hypothetical protein
MQQTSILIYIPRVTNRHRYIVDLIAEHVGVSCAIVPEIPAEKNRDTSIGINYSHTPVKGWIHMIPAGLLEMKGITGIPLEVTDHEGVPGLFPLKKESLLPYDIFSAIFYCVSRYEEYLPFKPDAHDRFPHSASWQHQYGCLNRPLVELWMAQFRNKLAEKAPGIQLHPPKSSSTITMDVDHPFKIYGKTVIKKWAAVTRSVLSQPKKTKQCILAMGSEASDPHNTLDIFKELSIGLGSAPRLFFLLNNKGKNNSSISPGNPAFQKLIKESTAWAEVGIHTSYGAAADATAIYQEKVLLEKITGGPVVTARQHFLRFTLPGYYRYLLQAGITADYSMGYAATESYRAGVSRPFFWYDLEREEITELKVHPFACMDATYTYYKKRRQGDIELIIRDLYQEVSNNHGIFSVLLHNDHISGEKKYPDWMKIIKALKSVDNL